MFRDTVTDSILAAPVFSRYSEMQNNRYTFYFSRSSRNSGKKKADTIDLFGKSVGIQAKNLPTQFFFFRFLSVSKGNGAFHTDKINGCVSVQGRGSQVFTDIFPSSGCSVTAPQSFVAKTAAPASFKRSRVS